METGVARLKVDPGRIRKKNGRVSGHREGRMKSDVNSLKSHPKVYIGIVHQLKEIISNDGLTPGDKLPSERDFPND